MRFDWVAQRVVTVRLAAIAVGAGLDLESVMVLRCAIVPVR